MTSIQNHIQKGGATISVPERPTLTQIVGMLLMVRVKTAYRSRNRVVFSHGDPGFATLREAILASEPSYGKTHFRLSDVVSNNTLWCKVTTSGGDSTITVTLDEQDGIINPMSATGDDEE